jgi:hypothetical protein
MNEKVQRILEVNIENIINTSLDDYKNDILNDQKDVLYTYSLFTNFKNYLEKLIKNEKDLNLYFFEYFCKAYIDLIKTSKIRNINPLFYRAYFIFTELFNYLYEYKFITVNSLVLNEQLKNLEEIIN